MSSASAEDPRRAAALAGLFHHRWAVPALAELSTGRGGGRFAPLARRLGVARAVLEKTLGALSSLGLVRRNPGYGHPLRPEYVLSTRGRVAGEWAVRLVRSVGRAGFEDAAGRKWSMPVLFAVHRGRHRFAEIQDLLPGITDRALALSLRTLQEGGLVDREVRDGHPPRSIYRPAPRARRLALLLAEVPAIVPARKAAGGVLRRRGPA